MDVKGKTELCSDAIFRPSFFTVSSGSYHSRSDDRVICDETDRGQGFPLPQRNPYADDSLGTLNVGKCGP
jgi:hypothetical protein